MRKIAGLSREGGSLHDRGGASNGAWEEGPLYSKGGEIRVSHGGSSWGKGDEKRRRCAGERATRKRTFVGEGLGKTLRWGSSATTRRWVKLCWAVARNGLITEKRSTEGAAKPFSGGV